MEKNMYSSSGATGSAPFPSAPLQTPMENMYSGPQPTDIDEYDFPDLDSLLENTNIDDFDDLCDREDLSNLTSCSAAQSNPLASPSFQTEPPPPPPSIEIGCNDPHNMGVFAPTSSSAAQPNPYRFPPPSLPIPPTENTTFPSAPQATVGPIDMGSGSLCRAAGNCSVAGTWASGWLLPYVSWTLQPSALQEEKARSTVRGILEQIMMDLELLNCPLVSIERDLATRDPGDSAVPRTHFTDSPVRKTRGGEWAEKKDGFKAFRDFHNRLEYVLAERTFQFKKTDPQNGGTNAVSRNKRNHTKEIDWEMKEYCLIRPHNNPGELFLEEDFAVRVISSTEKNAEAESSIRSILHENAEGSSNEAKLAGKRPRAAGPSDIWNHFIKIHTKDKDVVYALCPDCDKALRCVKHNTSTPRRHPCLLKHSQPSTITTTTEEAFLVGVKNVHISCA